MAQYRCRGAQLLAWLCQARCHPLCVVALPLRLLWRLSALCCLRLRWQARVVPRQAVAHALMLTQAPVPLRSNLLQSQQLLRWQSRAVANIYIQEVGGQHCWQCGPQLTVPTWR